MPIKITQKNVPQNIRGWKYIRLSDCVTDVAGTWGDEDIRTGLPVLRSTNFRSDGYFDYSNIAKRKIPGKDIKVKRLQLGDILLERSGGGPDQPVGRVGWCDRTAVGMYFSNFCQLLRPLQGVNSKFLFYLLHYFYVSKETFKHQQQTTGIRNLDFSSYTGIKLFLPESLKEQGKIAEVLSSVDEVIYQAQKTIEQTLTLKKSLTQMLFTQGLPGKHKKFKKSEVGPIPSAWDLQPIDEICVVNPSQSEISGIKDATRVTFMPMESVSENAEGIRQYLEKEYGAIKKGYTYFKNMDILFAKITPCMENGKTAVAVNLKNGIGFGSTEFHILRPNTKGLLPEFVFYWVSREVFRNLAKTYFTGTAGQQRVQKWFFSYVSIPIPPIEEQKIIVNLLSQVDSKIQSSKIVVEGLIAVKKALMQVLLTGKMRVSCGE